MVVYLQELVDKCNLTIGGEYLQKIYIKLPDGCIREAKEITIDSEEDLIIVADKQ
jgi:hypothetical protein